MEAAADVRRLSHLVDRLKLELAGAAGEFAAIWAGETAADPEFALEQGRIGFAHLALLAHTARALTESPAAAPFDERHLPQQAEKHPVTRFRRDCARIVTADGRFLALAPQHYVPRARPPTAAAT